MCTIVYNRFPCPGYRSWSALGNLVARAFSSTLPCTNPARDSEFIATPETGTNLKRRNHLLAKRRIIRHFPRIQPKLAINSPALVRAQTVQLQSSHGLTRFDPAPNQPINSPRALYPWRYLLRVLVLGSSARRYR